ncbi:vacuolar sorting protein VPS33/slp1 [Spathaspora passalidarum NRRL Y-27907]|uniref:Vacuolar sorting protein VPS33/slp1 n=1 Tax=Spathaspora passalidarum (strain NRRL Y-27907 / 11-Y1) TaxID=619300 RepID=G3AM10_SPAPN|nr:vacuolar sorting protein VPS33/slp1 [Spathaspora passalidarum NRRL Y-27907]EGW33363.1 vacuolar sorting protein VPS33/slp1 [Spathaspora passalidarum NRRL Y-27907]
MTQESLNLNQFNESILNNLLTQLSKIYSSNNLLILDPILSPLLNNLTPFNRLKEAGKFQNIVWLNNEITSIQHQVFSKYTSLIIIIPGTSENLELLHKFIPNILNHVHGLKMNLIVKDLSRSLLYQINNLFDGILKFDSILQDDTKFDKPITITTGIKVFNWLTGPIHTDGILITEINEYSGIDNYFKSPLFQVNQLTKSLIQLLFHNKSIGKLLKLKNIYGKGNHSDLLIKELTNVKIPEYLSENLSKLEVEFYESQLHSNTNLIVLERNLDFMPLLFNQLNYHGIIDDLFDIRFDTIENLEEDVSKTLVGDELYQQDLKDLNFSSIGARLNKLAKFIQQQYKSSNATDDNLKDMKQLVSNLGNLTLQQDLIKKHTIIGESVLDKMNNEYQEFLEFQNDLFEMDYKLQLSKLKYFFNCNFPINFIWSGLLLVGYINDGISSKDLDWISQELQDNYGLGAIISLEQLIKYKLIRINHDSSSDFLSNLGLTQKKQTPVHSHSEEDYQVGITGGQDIFKSNYTLINKFWNLHPLEEEDAPETNQDSTNLLEMYSNPSFTLPGNTVPLTYRIVESLYFRDFLKYKPINNIKKRPNWDNLGLGTMFSGKTIDVNIDDHSDDKNNPQKGNLVANPEYIIIAIIGGITRSEITCFKYLQERLTRSDKNKKIIVMSNGIVNNSKLFKFINE